MSDRDSDVESVAGSEAGSEQQSSVASSASSTVSRGRRTAVARTTTTAAAATSAEEASSAEEGDDGAKQPKHKVIRGKILRMELENFKSYRGKQVVGPFDDFSCIIGPNGAGKSNLMDAISFVMGLKAAVLRSANLRQLIYNADGRQQAEQRTAHVRLIFQLLQDTETMRAGHEIRFQRDIDAEGHSEYRIDGRVVSAQDYEDRLKTYGILSRARNFLVFQGDVESVAAKGSKDLCKLIEQVSGSEQHRKEYERLSDDMQAANQLVLSLSQKKKTVTQEKNKYKAQQKEAEEFEEKTKEYAEIQTNYALWKLYHVERDIAKHRREIDAKIKPQMAQAEVRDNTIDEQLKAKKKEFGELKKQQLEQQKGQKSHDKKTADKRAEQQELQVQVSHLEVSIETNRKRLDKKRKQVEKRNKEIAELENQLKQVRDDEAAFERQLAQEATEEVQLSEAQVQEYNRLKNQSGAQTITLRQQLDRLTAEQNAIKESKAAVEQKVDQLRKRLEQLNQQRQQLQARLDKEHDTLDRLRKDDKDKRVVIAKLETEQEDRQDRKHRLEAELEQIAEQLKDARVQREESGREAKFREAIDALKRVFQGVYGKLIDLCKVSRAKYGVAVTVALGKHADAIVVEDEKTALECIEYLKEQRTVSATFLPLDTIKPKQIKEKLRKIKNAKLAIDVIQFGSSVAGAAAGTAASDSESTAESEESLHRDTAASSRHGHGHAFDEKLEKAFSYALGNTLVCESIDDAMDLCFNHPELGGDKGLKAVTVDGTVIHKSGIMTGGQAEVRDRTTTAAQAFSEAEVERLKQRRDRAMQELNDLTREEAQSTAQLSSEQSDVDAIANRIRYMETDETLVAGKLKAVEGEIDTVHKSLDEEATHSTEQDTQIEEMDDQIDENKRRIAEIEDRIFQQFSRQVGVANIRQYEEQRRRTEDQAAVRRNEYKTNRSRIENQLEFEREREGVAQEAQKLEQDTKKAQDELDKHRRNLEKVTAELNKLNEAGKKLDKELARTKQALDDKELEMNTLKKEVQEVHAQQATLQRQITAKENQIDQLRNRRQDIVRRCKLDEIELPTVEAEGAPAPKKRRTAQSSDAMEDSEDAEAFVHQSESFSLSDDSSSETPTRSVRAREESIVLDFSTLDRSLFVKEGDVVAYKKIDEEFQQDLADLQGEIQALAPSMKGSEKYRAIAEKFEKAADEFRDAQLRAKQATDAFEAVKKKRLAAFMGAFEPISNSIDQIYKDLTKSTKYPLGGTAYLGMEDADEPYLAGIKYSAMPPMKRYRSMEELSGGEKTIAALALLFAIHSYRPSPVFILDEIDAALDSVNVNKVATYIRQRAGAGDVQFLVISLKENFYTLGDSLVGIYRDAQEQCSRVLTLNLQEYE